MQFDLVSSLTGFLLGTATGASATYFANKYTDRRRAKEVVNRAKGEFLAVKAQMAGLITEMKADLSGQGHEHVREFFVLPNNRVRVGGSAKLRFNYCEDEHENLRGKIDILEGKDYLSDVTTGNTPIYRMMEGFVEMVRRYG